MVGGLVPKENLGFYLFLGSLYFYLYQEGAMVEPRHRKSLQEVPDTYHFSPQAVLERGQRGRDRGGEGERGLG